MERLLSEIKQDYIQAESLLHDYDSLVKLQSKLEYDVSKETLQQISKFNNEICNRHGISTKEYDSCEFVVMENLDYSSNVVVEIAKEDLKSVIWTIIEKIKQFIINAYNKLKLFFIKLTTLHPIAEKNMYKLIDNIKTLKNTKAFMINNRRDLKWVVNKAPMLFLITQDVHQLEKFVSSDTHTPIVDGFMKEIHIIAKALQVNPDVDLQGFLTNANKAIETILNVKQSTSAYEPLAKLLPDINKEKHKSVIFRVDKSICKYRVYEPGKIENGVQTIKFNTLKSGLPINVEDKIVITKLYSPDEIMRLLKVNIDYIGNIKQLSTYIDSKVTECRDLTKSIESTISKETKSGAYKVLLGTYLKMVNFFTNTLGVEVISSNYHTAMNIYYACNKYIELGFRLDRNVSTESQLPNLPEGVVNGSNPDYVKALSLNEDPSDEINVHLNNVSMYSIGYKKGNETINIVNKEVLLTIMEDLFKDTFVEELKNTQGNGYLNLFNAEANNGFVNLRHGLDNAIIDIKSKLNDNLVEVTEYAIEPNTDLSITPDDVLDYLNIEPNEKINRDLYSYLLKYIDTLTSVLNNISSKLNASRNVKSNTVVS